MDYKWYEVLTDPFHNVRRLNLHRFDGSPMPPMFLADKSPHMLPTQTLNVTVKQATGTSTSNAKRDVVGGSEITGPVKNALVKFTEPANAEKWWWLGVIMTSIGSVVLIYS